MPDVSIGPRKSSTQEARGHSWASHHVLPAVHGRRRSRNETGIVGREEYHASRDLLRLAEAIDRNLRQDAFLQHLLRHRLHHLGVDIARANYIHGDAALGILERERLGEADVAGLGCRIIDLAELALLAVDRRDIDYAADTIDGPPSPLAFIGKALVERTKIDHHALMRAAADLFRLVARGDLEFDSFALDLDDLGFGPNLMTDGCSGKMPYIDRGADRALAPVEIRPDGGKRRVFHDQDHHRRRQYLRQHGVLEPVGEMLRLHTQRERCFCSQRYFAHAIHPLNSRHPRSWTFR